MPARQDGRPLYYDLAAGAKVQCVLCMADGNEASFTRGEAVLNDPANSPVEEGAIYTISIQRLPDDAVIYDPETNTCRNKSGDNTWVE